MCVPLWIDRDSTLVLRVFVPFDQRSETNDPGITQVSSKTSLSSESDRKGQGVNLALLIIGRKYVTLEEKQMEILRIAIVEKKDAVLPAGFGKSLVRL